MDIVKTVNDVAALYQSGLIESDGCYQCPVCKKEYKNLKSAQKHIEKQDCFKVQDLFEGTAHEDNAYVMFKEILATTNPAARSSIHIFRKSKMYGPVVRFIVFCSYHDVDDRGLYYTWLNEIVGIKYPNKILSEAIKESRLREFRKFLYSNPSLVDSASYVDKYKQDLIDDQKFFIRSIEKAHVTVQYLANSDFPFDDVCAKLYPEYYSRLLEVVDG